jgi:hypothetical protein
MGWARDKSGMALAQHAASARVRAQSRIERQSQRVEPFDGKTLILLSEIVQILG